eukprot:4517312-Karenia_brevis.AAC.1
MCQVRNGVFQGCPLASPPIVIAMDPFVQVFAAEIDSLGIGVSCLCADEIGIALRSWRDLCKAFLMFALA